MPWVRGGAASVGGSRRDCSAAAADLEMRRAGSTPLLDQGERRKISSDAGGDDVRR